MGILTVAEASGQRAIKRQGFAGSALVVEIGTDGAVVGCCRGKGLHGKAGAEFGGCGTIPGLHCLEDSGIVVGIDHHGDGAVVLGSAADHGGAPDVDLLDGLGQSDPFLCHRLLKGVEIHTDEINRKDAMLGRLSGMLGIIAQEEKPAVDLRQEGFNPSIHHLRESGVVRDLTDRNAGGGDGLGGAAGGEELDAQIGKAAGEVDKTGLVGNREECALDVHAEKSGGWNRFRPRA